MVINIALSVQYNGGLLPPYVILLIQGLIPPKCFLCPEGLGVFSYVLLMTSYYIIYMYCIVLYTITRGG